MEIRPVQFNINTKSNEHKHYLEAEGAIDTTGLVKPLPGKGHLVHDSLLTGPKYFVKDFAYDMKSLKNGIKGTANDHQLGRLNDVGLQLGGVGIATYLASKTTNPKARIMEYAGLAAFLTAMNVYPKIAINKPAEFFHGYDIDKWYIDDQGRKKSVNQDSNYRPMDLYRGEAKREDLAEIGDRMGIPRDIKNRDALIKEQTRKLSTQSNTLWMLTAGLATPAMTALACYGLENYVISPQLEKSRNNKYNKLIAEIYEKTDKKMPLDINEIPENDLSSKISGMLSKYKGQQLPKEELNRILEVLTENIDSNAAEGIKTDFAKVLEDTTVLNGDIVEAMGSSAKKLISGEKKADVEQVLIPAREELENLIKRVVPDADFVNGSVTSTENIMEIKKALRSELDSRIEKYSGNVSKKFLQGQRNKIINSMTATLESNKAKVVTDNSFDSIVNFAKIMGEFKENNSVLDKCHNFKFEFAPETTLARSYAKFEKALVKELGITTKDMKQMRESEEYTVELLNKKITELCQDESRYRKTFEKLGKIISEMEVNLNGASEEGSYVLDMIRSIENNYNNTAKRLASIGGFDTTISRLVKDKDVANLKPSIETRQELFDFLDGIVENKFKMGVEGREVEYAKYNSNGMGSSKYLQISRTLERYQGVKNSFNRVLHTFEVFKRTMDPNEFLKTLSGLEGKDHIQLSRTDIDYIQKLIKKGRETMLTATSADHNLKLDLVNNPAFYTDVMNSIWAPAPAQDFWSTKAQGYVTDIAKDTLGEHNNIAEGNVLDRFRMYITRFRNIVANSPIDFTKPFHGTNPHIRNSYTQAEKTNMAFFNLVGQTPLDFLQGASKRQYSTKKWFHIISGVTASVFAVTILAQAGFGKIRNPQNIQKQVKDETN